MQSSGQREIHIFLLLFLCCLLLFCNLLKDDRVNGCSGNFYNCIYLFTIIARLAGFFLFFFYLFMEHARDCHQKSIEFQILTRHSGSASIR